MISGKHFDPILGLDIHIILIPTPAGPVPTPLPHPYIGFMLDPLDWIPKIGASVWVNGLPRSQAGTAGFEVPKHIPMGGMFQKPPTFESEMFMGSSTVSIEGEPFSFLALPLLSCHDIGMPAPPRLKKKNAAKSLMLPTTVLLAIPMGMLTVVGGPPTISLMSIAANLGLAALGKGLKKLGKMRKGSRRMKALSDKLHAKANKLCDKLGLGDAARARVHKGVCTVTGHPVDVATGKVFTDRVDFELPGPIPFKLERTWYSTSTYRGPLGHGWHHSYDLALHVTDDGLLLRTADGRHVGLPLVTPGESYFEPKERLTLRCDGPRTYSVQGVDGLRYLFATTPARAGRSTEHAAVSDELRLAFIRDRSGNQLVFERDARGELSRIVDSAGRILEVQNDEQGRIRALRAPHPDRTGQWVNVVEYRYDQRGDLVECRDALGAPMRFVYKNHLLTQETDRAGLSFYFEYDGTDETAKCTHTWGDGGIYDHKLSYDPITCITKVENSLGYKTLYQHDDGLVVRAVDPIGATTLVKYDQQDRKLSETDPNGLTSTYQYDERGNLTQLLAPNGAKRTLHYGTDDQPLLMVDALGGSWRFHYDEAGRLIERTDPLERRKRMWYAGRLLAGITDSEDHATALSYDAEHNLVTLTTPDHVVARFGYDGWGRLIEVIDGKGNGQRRHFDLLGNLLQVEEPDGNLRVLRYDPEGRIVHAKDLQREVEFGYQGMGRLAHQTEARTTIRFEYDSEEQLTGVQNEHGHVYGFQLDARGEVEVETGFDGVRRLYRRDLGGRVSEVERASGLRSKYCYDTASRVAKIEHSDGTKESYAYRIDGALLQATNRDCTLRFERDALGRIVKEGYGAHWVESGYALSGLRSEVRSSLGAHQRIARNVMGDVLCVETGDGSFMAQFKRDALGLELERELPGGVRSRWKRDRLGRPIEHELTRASKPLRARSYTWDVNERLRMVIDAVQGPIHYTHDALGHLMAARYVDGTADLRLPDAVGNLFKREDRGDRKYGPAGQLLEARGPRGLTRYVYDGEGNLIEKHEPDQRVWRYVWNAAGMLAKVTRPDGREITFAYDALGRRIKKSYRGKTTNWVWDGNVPLHEWVELTDPQAAREEDPATPGASVIALSQREAQLSAQPAQAPPPMLRPDQGTRSMPITWLFEPESFAPLAKLVGEQRHSIVTDHLGTPVSVLDARGELVWAAGMDSYGALRELLGERSACPFRWPGQYEDVETGLYYNRFRYYDPDSGQYTSQDPMRYAAGLKLHAYVDDPNGQLDPQGLHIASAMFTDSRGTTHDLGSFDSKGGSHSEPKILDAVSARDNVNGGRVEITSLGPKGDGSTGFFRGKSGKAYPAGPLPPCGPRAANCDALLERFARDNNVEITYRWNQNVQVYSPDGRVTRNGELLRTGCS
jgi:RHS repeat-associated protein